MHPIPFDHSKGYEIQSFYMTVFKFTVAKIAMNHLRAKKIKNCRKELQL